MSLLGAVSASLHSSSADTDRQVAARDFSEPNIDPLPAYHRHGLIVISAFALLSAVATLGMFIFMTVRLVFWRRFGNVYPGYNQYIILIYNLLIADLIQSCAFSLNLYWIATNSIKSPSAVCAVQGLFIQLGDPGSGLFALAIAAHTFMQAVFGRKIEYKWFVTGILSIWGFMVIMCIIPIASHWDDSDPVFAPTGAWCWLNSKHEADRLWTHYCWIFMAEFCTLVLYGIIFIQLRRKIASSMAVRNGNRNAQSLTRLTRITYLMVMYPIAYVVLSLPLAVGRMSTERGHTPSVTYFCVAGSMITSTGFFDVMMYTFTRRAITVEHHNHHQSPPNPRHPQPSTLTSSALNPFHHYDYRSNHIATVVAMTTFVPDPPSSRYPNTSKRRRNNGGFFARLPFFFRRRTASSPSVENGNNESCESFARLKDDERNAHHHHHHNNNNTATTNTNNPESDLSRVFQETTIEVTSEPAYPAVEGGGRSLSLSSSSRNRATTAGHFETME